MTDRRDDDFELDEGERNDEPARSVTPTGPPEGGVRILGAEEAQAVLDAGQAARRLGDDDVRFGDVPPRPDPSVRPAARFPTPGGAPPGPTWLASDRPAAGTGPRPGPTEPAGTASEPGGTTRPERGGAASPEPDGVPDVETSGPVPLPHWTEPPTGEVPVILPEAEPVDITGEEDLDAWVSAPGGTPRYRSGAGDWTESDFAPGESLKDESTALGALADHPDDDREFDEQVAQRRRRLRPRSSGRAAGATETPSAPRRGGASREDAGTRAAAGAEVRDMPTRVITGIGVGVLALVCFKLGRGPTAVLAAAIVAISVFELSEGLRKKGFHPATLLALLGSVTIVLAAYKRGEAAFPLLIALMVVFTLLWYLVEVVRARPVVNVGVTLLVFGYIGVLGGFAGLLLAFPHGVGLILGLAICVVGYDLFGFLIGSQFGKTRLAPRISPNKTVEGLLGGMTASVLLGVAVVSQITPWKDVGHALALGVVVAVMAPLGDLCESMLKRDLGVKDLGTILPGHGGILDRFDAVLFCLPAVYYLAHYFFI